MNSTLPFRDHSEGLCYDCWCSRLGAPPMTPRNEWYAWSGAFWVFECGHTQVPSKFCKTKTKESI